MLFKIHAQYAITSVVTEYIFSRRPKELQNAQVEISKMLGHRLRRKILLVNPHTGGHYLYEHGMYLARSMCYVVRTIYR